MSRRSAPATKPEIRLRRGRMSDVPALVALEQALFTTDVLSRRSFRRFVCAPGAALMVAEEGGKLAGYALVLYPPRSKLARLYSIAVAPHIGGRGVGPRLLAAAEAAAQRHGRRAMRLEVNEHNTRAIARYEKSGYRLFGRHSSYYDGRADALRFEKPLGLERVSGGRSAGNRTDSPGRIGFDGGHPGRRSRQSLRARL